MSRDMWKKRGCAAESSQTVDSRRGTVYLRQIGSRWTVDGKQSDMGQTVYGWQTGKGMTAGGQ